MGGVGEVGGVGGVGGVPGSPGAALRPPAFPQGSWSALRSVTLAAGVWSWGRGGGREGPALGVPTSPRLRITTFPLPERKQCYYYISNSLMCDPAARIILRDGVLRAGRRCDRSFHIPPAGPYIIPPLSKRIFSRLGFVIKIVINFFLFTKPRGLEMEASAARAISF